MKTNIYIPEKNYEFENKPHVDVIILTKDHINLLFTCIDSIINKSTYPNYRIIIGDTGSTNDNLNSIRKFIVGKNIELVDSLEYRFGRLNNQLANKFNNHDPDSLLLFCNNDIEFLNDCISEMVFAHENIENAGTIGARLHYPDGSIQHAGVAATSNGGLTHIGANTYPNEFYGSNNYSQPYHVVFGSTGALLMISRKNFSEVNGFNENYKVCFEDVELNLQMMMHGYQNVISYDAVAFHKEKQTRGQQLDKTDWYRYQIAFNKYMVYNLEKHNV